MITYTNTMSKLSSVVVSCILSRRCYGVQAAAAGAMNVNAAAARRKGAGDAAGMVVDDEAKARKKKEEVFWMRDPKTGCWIPENRFDEVDAVELRKRLLRRNRN